MTFLAPRGGNCRVPPINSTHPPTVYLLSPLVFSLLLSLLSVVVVEVRRGGGGGCGSSCNYSSSNSSTQLQHFYHSILH